MINSYPPPPDLDEDGRRIWYSMLMEQDFDVSKLSFLGTYCGLVVSYRTVEREIRYLRRKERDQADEFLLMLFQDLHDNQGPLIELYCRILGIKSPIYSN